jgi:hypothetical protein
MENPITNHINFFTPFQDFHLVSQDYRINKAVLENWTLHKVKVPDFKNKDEMKDWIIAVDFIIKSESLVISGPAFPYYQAIENDSFYTKQLYIEDINGKQYNIPKRNYYNKNAQPINLLDTKKLYDYLSEPSDVLLDIDTYGNWPANKKIEGKNFFGQINMCGIVDFLLNSVRPIYLPPQDQLMFGIKTEDYSIEENFDETNAFWTFKNIKENNQVFVIEFKYQEAKKEDQLNYFNSWVMWHEKFIYNNIMYFVLFQTDEIDRENMTEYFNPLKKTISKRYRINSYILERQRYFELKTRLRNSDLNDK